MDLRGVDKEQGEARAFDLANDDDDDHDDDQQCMFYLYV